MKIETIVLKEMEIVQIDGEFKQTFKNEKRVPCFLTNHVLKRGKETGVLKSSLISDLVKLQGLESLDENDTLAALENLDEDKMQRTIYLAYKGANRSSDLDFDQFIELYHYSFTETAQIYLKVAQDAITNDPNAFAQELNKSTKQEKKM